MNRMPDGRVPGSSRAGVLAVAAAAVLIAIAIGLYQAGGDPGATAMPSLLAGRTVAPRTLAPSPTSLAPTNVPAPTIDPGSVGDCGARRLALVAGGWGGATGAMAGAATVLNVSSDVCRVSGIPALELRDGSGKIIAKGGAPSAGAPVVLAPGGAAWVTTVWANWCHDPPARPFSLRLSLANGQATLKAPVVDWNVTGGIGGEEFSSLPRCDEEGAPSTIAVPQPFAAPGPPEPGEVADPCIPDALIALLGTWGAAAGSLDAPVIVFNQAGSDCELPGSPTLQLRDGEGKVVTVGESEPDASTLLLPAGWAAVTWVHYANWCLPRPKLPLRMNLVVAGERVAIAPTSDGSTLGTPACVSDPPTSAPSFGYNGPFELPAT